MTMTELRKRLAELSAKATPGPWRSHNGWVCRLSECDSDGCSRIVTAGTQPIKESRCDMPLIAEARNALPALLVVLEKAQAALEHADEWLDELGCDCGMDEPGTCAFCETRAALAALTTAKVGE